MQNVIFGVLLCAVYANGINVIYDLEGDIRQPQSTLTQQISGPFTGPSGTTCNNKGICENQPDGAMFSDPGSNGYIVCQCECAITRPCPSGLVFNPVINACDWPIVNSSPATGPSGTTCNNKGVCENQPDGALFPDFGSNGYIVCQCECEIPMSCPSGLVFNPVINSCDWPLVNTDAPGTSSSPSDITTKDTPSTPSSTPKYTTSSPSPSPPSDITTKSTATTTSSSPSEITTNGIPSTPSSTPKYTTSSPSPSTPSDITTKSTPTTSKIPATGPSGTTCNNKGICENQPDGALFPDSGSNGYIVCQCECGISRPCPLGLVFNPTLSVCDWPTSN
ncbi:probable chitinase 10 [Zeugodacus cucurbitae]|uniref:probable chitinase 10 n=1 Tax=Zeugodacus cucurbitae TaxID=28588 RepID=UPI0005968701|nr:probable chitinase 10 [Zeugodacus cucurbitae]